MNTTVEIEADMAFWVTATISYRKDGVWKPEDKKETGKLYYTFVQVGLILFKRYVNEFNDQHTHLQFIIVYLI
jgi:hypothetical protein